MEKKKGMPPMDIRQLEAYVYTVKYRSFSLAAQKLYLSQPTVSAPWFSNKMTSCSFKNGAMPSGTSSVEGVPYGAIGTEPIAMTDSIIA